MQSAIKAPLTDIGRDIPGPKMDFDSVGTDVNTFVGFGLFSLKRKYGIYEDLAPGYENDPCVTKVCSSIP